MAPKRGGSSKVSTEVISTTAGPGTQHIKVLSPLLQNEVSIKRSTLPTPVLDHQHRHVDSPDHSAAKLRNELEAILYLRKHTSVPVPSVIASFEDRDAFYLILDNPTTRPATEAPDQPTREYIKYQLTEYMAEIKQCKSNTIRSFVNGSLFLSDQKIGQNADLLNSAIYPKRFGDDAYILCHNNLHWDNIRCDPDTWEIVQIINWENAGFFPAEFEGEGWKSDKSTRRVHNIETRGAVDDLVSKLYSLLDNSREEDKDFLNPLKSQLDERKATDIEESSGSLTPKAEVGGREVSSSLRTSHGAQSSKKETGPTPLQQRLWRLHLERPPLVYMSSRELSVLRWITTSHGIAQDLRQLATDLEEQAKACQALLGDTRQDNNTHLKLVDGKLTFRTFYGAYSSQ